VRRLAPSLLFVLALLAPSLGLAQKTYTTENRHFIVVGEDFGSARAVVDIADKMQTVARDYLEAPSTFNRKVEVRLVPPGKYTEKQPYRLFEDSRGGVGVLIRWSDDTELNTVCEAIARSYLKYLTTFRFGKEASRDMPDWLELAMSLELRSRVRPGYVEYLSAQAKSQPLVGLRELLTAQSPYRKGRWPTELSAFWLLRHLQREAPEATLFAQFLNFCLSGRDNLELVVNSYRNRFSSPQEMESWWAVGYHFEISRRQNPFFSLEESRENLLNRAFVTVTLEDEEQRLTGQGLWAQREQVSVRRAVAGQLKALGADMTRVNPVYFNAHFALLRSYEALLKGELAVYEAANEDFLKDFKTASYLEEQTNQLLETR